MVRLRRFGIGALIAAIAIVITGCDYNFTAPTPVVVAPSATPPASALDTVEFRVEGDLPSVTVRINNSLDGLTQIATGLPYSSTLSIAGRDNVFLSIEARALGSGWLHVAIFVNGYLFRESSSTQFAPIVIASGTFRRAARTAAVP